VPAPPEDPPEVVVIDLSPERGGANQLDVSLWWFVPLRVAHYFALDWDVDRQDLRTAPQRIAVAVSARRGIPKH